MTLFIIITMSMAKMNLANAAQPPEKLSVRETICELNNLATHSPKLAQKQLGISLLEAQNLNPAEQYLLTLVKVKIEDVSDHWRRLVLLESLLPLAESIPIEQLQSTEFNQGYHWLAQAYSQTGDFENAYKYKKIYLEYFINNIEQINKQETLALKEKYEISRAEIEHQLLVNRTTINEQKIIEANNTKRLYQQNIVVIVLFVFIFIFLLVRQVLLSKDLKTLAKRDNLTGLYNRRNLFKRGQILAENYAKHHQEFCLLMIDIDHFKNVNDNYGHDVGDKVLKRFAKIGKSCMRKGEVLARIGGEEFIVLFPRESLSQSFDVAERFRQKLEQTSFKVGKQKTLQVTASFGLVAMSDIDGSFNTLLNAADQAMYQAKQQGRNQVVKYQA